MQYLRWHWIIIMMDNNCSPDSQLFPVQPCVHTQVKESFLTRHKPSFWQGELLHTWVTSIQKKRNIPRCVIGMLQFSYGEIYDFNSKRWIFHICNINKTRNYLNQKDNISFFIVLTRLYLVILFFAAKYDQGHYFSPHIKDLNRNMDISKKWQLPKLQNIICFFFV